MKLNPDCIRDLLLRVEETTDFTTSDTPSDFRPLLDNYSGNEILYHLKQCKQSGLIEIKFTAGYSFIIRDLTPAGHNFLANIRQNDNWSKIKNHAKKVGSFSLDVLKSIAVEVITKKLN